MLFRYIKKVFLKRKIKNMAIRKIICGAGGTHYTGWVSFDIDTLNITKESDFEFYFEKNSISNILVEHVVEHLEKEEFIKFLQIAKTYLTRGGVIRIAVPDKFHPSRYVRELTGANGTEPGAEDHKFFYSIEDFEDIAKDLKYRIDKIEFFDSDGIFHMKDFSYENGYISRCSKNYMGRFTNNNEEYMKMITTVPENLRNQLIKNNISYASLLVDFISE